jgi:choline kinase
MSIAAVVLAAGLGTRLRPLTDEVPKCLVPLAGRPLIEQALDSLQSGGVESVVVVSGYRATAVAAAVAKVAASRERLFAVCAENRDFARTGTASSLLTGLATLGAAGWDGEVMVAEGDVWFDRGLVTRLTRQEYPDVVAVDQRGVGGDGSLLRLSADGTVESWYFLSDGSELPDGEVVRLANVYRFGSAGWRDVLLPRLKEAVTADPRLPLERFLGSVGRTGEIALRGVMVSDCCWWEIDTEADLVAAAARCQDGLPAHEAMAIGRRAATPLG